MFTEAADVWACPDKTRRPNRRIVIPPRAEYVVSLQDFTYIPPAMQQVALKEFRADEWCFDPYAKQCERCDIIIGRYAVMKDDQGLRQVVFWPHAEWDGVEGSCRCRTHTRPVQRWLRLF